MIVYYNSIKRKRNMPNKFVYSDFEKQKNKELEFLFSDWIKQLSKNKTPIDNGNKEKTTPADCFAKDGFFPGYFDENNLKVCFIGRETRLIGGHDFRDTTKEFFEIDFSKNNNWWRHILYIVYGIKTKGEFKFEEIPDSLGILNEMYDSKKYGFASINISKYSNDNKSNWQTNINLVHRFLKDSELEKTNFFQKELEILNPDVIITANLWDIIESDYINLCLPESNFSETKNIIHNGESIAEYGKYNLNGKTIDFIDLYHFSAKKSDKYCYYNPVMKILFNKNRK